MHVVVVNPRASFKSSKLYCLSVGGESEGIPLLMLLVVVVAAVALHSRLILLHSGKRLKASGSIVE
jgi:hypothetical protein